MAQVKGVVKRSFNTRLYTAYVDGVIIGDFGFKFQAKRAIRKYIKNNFSNQRVVYEKNYSLKGVSAAEV